MTSGEGKETCPRLDPASTHRIVMLFNHLLGQTSRRLVEQA